MEIFVNQIMLVRRLVLKVGPWANSKAVTVHSVKLQVPGATQTPETPLRVEPGKLFQQTLQGMLMHSQV